MKEENTIIPIDILEHSWDSQHLFNTQSKKIHSICRNRGTTLANPHSLYTWWWKTGSLPPLFRNKMEMDILTTSGQPWSELSNQSSWPSTCIYPDQKENIWLTVSTAWQPITSSRCMNILFQLYEPVLKKRRYERRDMICRWYDPAYRYSKPRKIQL